MKRSVMVLGHRGMLGAVVRSYFCKLGYRVDTSDNRFSGEAEDPLVNDVIASQAEVVINCAGVLPRSPSANRNLFVVNTLLPLRLALALGRGRRLVHASTDGVFNAEQGGHSVADEPDADDSYGASKRAGELARHLGTVTIVRSSIVDITSGVLGWLAAQSGTVPGYTNHVWNGVTTLEWAIWCEEFIEREMHLIPSIAHLSCMEPISKFDLLCAAVQAFRLPAVVVPEVSAAPRDQTLVPTHRRPPILEQLVELRSWDRAPLPRANCPSGQ
jgi:dTDP-4-dehydrorhamnose reductase